MNLAEGRWELTRVRSLVNASEEGTRARGDDVVDVVDAEEEHGQEDEGGRRSEDWESTYQSCFL